MRPSYDVVIVGGGVTGSSTAYWLASQPGFDGSVLVVERDPTYEGAPSARATGGIRQQFSTPENVQMGLFGAEFVRSIDERLSVDGEGTGVIFREQGYLLLATEQALASMREAHAIQRELGADIVFKDTAALEREFPWVKTDGIEGAFFGASNEGWVDPYALLQAFKRKARACGAEYVADEALEVLESGQRATGVRLRDGGEIGAGVVVDAAGASGAAALAAGLGIDLPIESRQRCTFVYECREDISMGQLTVLPNGLAWRPEGARFVTSIVPPPERDPVTHDFNVDYWLFDEIIWP
ncbi:MAG: NAD(P)/FAD-dependent oxidoreductase, partial [Gammaproteobacteria bacterium]